MRRALLVVALLVVALLAVSASLPASAQPSASSPRGTLDTLTFWSQSLGVQKRAIVWLPPSYGGPGAQRYPTAYYLHGLYGSEGDWTRQGRLHLTLDSLVATGMREMIVVMPDGDDSWYTTWNRLLDVSSCRREFRPREGDTAESYCVPWSHYDDYIARDLVAAVDRGYRTAATRSQRVIAGLSMGGYGAISLALRYPDVFRAAASHSGVVSPLYVGPRPFQGTPRYAESPDALRKSWGERMWPLISPAFGSDAAGWIARDPARLAARLVNQGDVQVPAIFIDCGTEDGLIDQSRALRHELQRLGITPAYAEWPGKHDWDYWRRHSPESLTWLARQLSER
ncbi:MAG: alpha/beta hydrolase family protein [Gemmatimonadaceae bacterium]